MFYTRMSALGPQASRLVGFLFVCRVRVQEGGYRKDSEIFLGD